MKTLLTPSIIMLVLSALISCDPGEEPQDLLCTPGQSDACACENGLEGAQVCSDDGMSYGECTCEEPAPTCNPGEMDACVCENEELGMRECGEDETFGECVCENDTSSSEHIPGTQWVLRDKDGKAVPAIFEPVCTGDKEEQCDLSIDEKSYPCAFIHYLNGNPLWVAYDVTTGKPESCYYERKEWKKVGRYFDNETCDGIPFQRGFGQQQTLDSVVKIGGELYYIDTKKHGKILEIAYESDGDDCVLAEPQPMDDELYQYEELPMNMMGALSNAPYSISIE